MDGENIEIHEGTVEYNMHTFGLLTPEIGIARSKKKHGEYQVHDDCPSEALGQIRNNMDCGSDNLGPTVSLNSTNLLALELNFGHASNIR